MPPIHPANRSAVSSPHSSRTRNRLSDASSAAPPPPPSRRRPRTAVTNWSWVICTTVLRYASFRSAARSISSSSMRYVWTSSSSPLESNSLHSAASRERSRRLMRLFPVRILSRRPARQSSFGGSRAAAWWHARYATIAGGKSPRRRWASSCLSSSSASRIRVSSAYTTPRRFRRRRRVSTSTTPLTSVLSASLSADRVLWQRTRVWATSSLISCTLQIPCMNTSWCSRTWREMTATMRPRSSSTCSHSVST
mmetsp:Transcript_16058/g.31382  ORF Transcript_16058/g.31382 Transcript_16058/m.31382 type:complete len:252 (-) Transcript_16058:200-955(-)